MYTKRILNSTIIANIEVCFIQMQCVIEALICICKTFGINYKFLYCFKYLFIFIKNSDKSQQSRTLRLGLQISDTEFIKSRLTSVN